MEESIPSISSGLVGSRFVSQTDVDAAKARREEQWKAAYARLGQEPPPQPAEDSYDGRSLAEKLAANKAAKQEEWEEKTKLANQFRALEEDEIMFLDSVREKQELEEQHRKMKDGEEVKNFKQAVAARTSAANSAPPAALVLAPSPTTSTAPVLPVKKDAKKPSKGLSLKGVVVKKKSKAKAPAASTNANKAETEDQSPTAEGKRKYAESEEQPDDSTKRRKASSPEI